jgi:hypothetical protein
MLDGRSTHDTTQLASSGQVATSYGKRRRTSWLVQAAGAKDAQAWRRIERQHDWFDWRGSARCGSDAPSIRARPDGLYRESPLHDWFEHLASGKGLRCSFADADWDTIGGGYRVRVPIAAQSSDIVWVDVPDDAVITEPNKSGHTMVWPLYDYHGVSIRCFMPGNMT